jgi:hypothetical protein
MQFLSGEGVEAFSSELTWFHIASGIGARIGCDLRCDGWIDAIDKYSKYSRASDKTLIEDMYHFTSHLSATSGNNTKHQDD